MSFCDDFIEKVALQLPSGEFLTATDLIAVGLVKSPATLKRWRDKRQGPPYIQISEGTIKYPRQGLLAWLNRNTQLTFPFTKSTEVPHV